MEREYLNCIIDIIDNGELVQGRTKERYYQGYPISFTWDTSDGTIPLMTTKKVSWRNIVTELCWFLNGRSDLEFLHRYNNHIWDEWMMDDERGWKTAGKNYSYQWVKWQGWLDQIKSTYELLQTSPDTRRAVVTAWNPAELSQCSLPPCHYSFQLYILHDKLNMVVNQRSGDMFLGIPYNVASYSLLLQLFAYALHIEPGLVTHHIAIPHVYENHVMQCREQASREPLTFPKLKINMEGARVSLLRYPCPEWFGVIKDGKTMTIHRDRFVDCNKEAPGVFLVDYKHHPPIKADVAV